YVHTLVVTCCMSAPFLSPPTHCQRRTNCESQCSESYGFPTYQPIGSGYLEGSAAAHTSRTRSTNPRITYVLPAAAGSKQRGHADVVTRRAWGVRRPLP